VASCASAEQTLRAAVDLDTAVVAPESWRRALQSI
jgi:hypothetical protein